MEIKRFESENPAWGCFLRSRNDDRAKCKTCENTISCKDGSTGAMRNYLYLKHKILLDTNIAIQQVSLENATKVPRAPARLKTILNQPKSRWKGLLQSWQLWTEFLLTSFLLLSN